LFFFSPKFNSINTLFFNQNIKELPISALENTEHVVAWLIFFSQK